jgi:transketolase
MSNKIELEKKCINTICFLAADAIEKAKSGHPCLLLGNEPTFLLTYHL